MDNVSTAARRISLCDILFSWEQVEFMLGMKEAMLTPKLTYETDQSSTERANGGGWGHSPFMSRQSTSVTVPMLLLLPVYCTCTKHCACGPVQCPGYQFAACCCPKNSHAYFTKSCYMSSAKGRTAISFTRTNCSQKSSYLSWLSTPSKY